LLVLAILSPLLIVIVVAILIEGIQYLERRWSVFVRLPRISQRKRFSLLKFRISMQASDDNNDTCGNALAFTNAGTFLHSFHLGSLPQL